MHYKIFTNILFFVSAETSPTMITIERCGSNVRIYASNLEVSYRIFSARTDIKMIL